MRCTGASAGTVNGAWFAAGDPVRGIPALDWDAVLGASVPLHPLATDADTGAVVDLHDLVHDVATLKTAIRASTHLPILGGPPVRLGGRRLLDAALAETLPFRTPLAQGATHVVLLRTRRADDPLRAPWRSGDLMARGLLAIAAPGAGRVWRSRYERVCGEETWPAAHPDTVLTIRPPAGSPSITQRSRSEQLLRRGWRSAGGPPSPRCRRSRWRAAGEIRVGCPVAPNR